MCPASSLSAFRAAIVWAVCSSKMPLANIPAVLNLLDGPVGVDPALHIIWVRFRTMRRYLAYFPDKEARIFRLLDLISRGGPWPCSVHLLLISAAELGFAWDGGVRGWVRLSLPPLGMMTGPIQHFFSSILDAWRLRVFAQLAERKGFRCVQFADLKGSLQLLTSSHLREREKCCSEPFCAVVFCTDSFLVRPTRMMFPASFVAKKRWRWSFVLGMHLSTFVACGC